MGSQSTKDITHSNIKVVHVPKLTIIVSLSQYPSCCIYGIIIIIWEWMENICWDLRDLKPALLRGLLDDDDGAWLLNFYVMVNEQVIIMWCHVMRILRLMFYVWFLYIMLYMWW